jgi:hypothetical protein
MSNAFNNTAQRTNYSQNYKMWSIYNYLCYNIGNDSSSSIWIPINEKNIYKYIHSSDF